MTIEFKKVDDLLILTYKASGDIGWLIHKLIEGDVAIIQRTFSFDNSSLYDVTVSELESEIQDPAVNRHSLDFVLGKKSKDYYKINSGVLSTRLPVYIHKDMKLKEKRFISAKNISIFQRIDNLVKSKIIIGGSGLNSLPEEEFIKLTNNFPNTYEQRKYANAIVSSMLCNYFDEVTDAEESYHAYINKKERTFTKGNITQSLKEQEIHKYELLLKKLEYMLSNEINYSEQEWQDEIIKIILLLYPKYIHAFTEVVIKDVYNNKNRRLDIMLLDSAGNIDLIEIKKPFDHAIMTKGKYRDNYIPLRELSGTVMQIEKYIFYLNKWGRKGEKALTEKFKLQIPDELQITITNPSALIIMGRDNKLTKPQKEDFKIIKRKYRNIADIITYDDLLSRLRFTIEQWKMT